MQRRNHSKNIYRQFDPASLHTLTSQPDARVTSVTTSPLSHEYAIIYFDQVITANNSPTVAPLWTIGSQTLVAFIELAADGKSLLTQWSGAIDVGDTVTMGDMATNWGFNTTLGGTFIDYSGTVAALPTSATFDLVSIQALDTDKVLLNFDAPIAFVPNRTPLETWISLNHVGLAIGSGSNYSILSATTDRQLVVSVNGDAYTSGQAWTIVADSAAFVSLTAARTNAASGTIDPA